VIAPVAITEPVMFNDPVKNGIFVYFFK
jgi:hypothetical protein